MASAGQQRGPCHLLAMPLEILTEIASNLTYSSSSLEGLSRLGRTCRALFIVVTPVLYRHIHLYLPLYPMLARCARSLVTCPARCEHIQSINIRRIYKDRYYTKSDREVLDEIVQPLFGIHAFEPKRFGNVDLAIMAVICLAQNLETLEISHFYESSGNTDSLLQEVNNRVRQRSACTLSKLTTLTFKPPSKKAKINLDKLNGLLNAAPNLQSLHIDAATGGSSLAVSLTNLTTLCLEDSHLGYQGLRLLTQPCVNLTYFKFAHFKSFDEPAWRPFSAAQILDCLKPCSAQLQHLHLEPLARLVDYVIEDEDEVHFPPLISLRGFPALRQVAVDPQAITPRSDGQGGLVGLLQDCPALEGILLIDVKEVSSEELESIAHAVLDLMLWPRLSMIKFQTYARSAPWCYTRTVLERVEARLLSDTSDINASKIRETGVDLLVAEGDKIWVVSDEGLVEESD